ncbi:hypothetical protein T02_7556 [Trichinella nativa]|uniref:Uncharacterized protein n=1 Tax=Trichinella nativa TaxID=6335 RepID=A0A0V1L7G8_9BILA|nr:hypothetical protein T02_7556 [Trichinella nativa]
MGSSLAARNARHLRRRSKLPLAAGELPGFGPFDLRFAHGAVGHLAAPLQRPLLRVIRCQNCLRKKPLSGYRRRPLLTPTPGP